MWSYLSYFLVPFAALGLLLIAKLVSGGFARHRKKAAKRTPGELASRAEQPEHRRIAQGLISGPAGLQEPHPGAQEASTGQCVCARCECDGDHAQRATQN
nr:hypothetical protein [Delftia sp. PE138]